MCTYYEESLSTRSAPCAGGWQEIDRQDSASGDNAGMLCYRHGVGCFVILLSSCEVDASSVEVGKYQLGSYQYEHCCSQVSCPPHTAGRSSPLSTYRNPSSLEQLSLLCYLIQTLNAIRRHPLLSCLLVCSAENESSGSSSCATSAISESALVSSLFFRSGPLFPACVRRAFAQCSAVSS